MAERNSKLLQKCKYLSGDRGYDDTKLHTKLWDKHQIKPVIDIRRSWKDGEETGAFKDSDGVAYDNKGQVFCFSPHFADRKTIGCRSLDRGEYIMVKPHYTAL